jgi:cell division protein FtsZ
MTDTDFTPRITVVGVGGGALNAIDHMISAHFGGVEFAVADTDRQRLDRCGAVRRIGLGPDTSLGFGVDLKPEAVNAAAEAAVLEIDGHLNGAHMVFIVVGMGGVTGTNAASVIARRARDRGILTVGVATAPFAFERSDRTRVAENGIIELRRNVNTLIVVPNDEIGDNSTDRADRPAAFEMMDNAIYNGVRGVTAMLLEHNLIGIDFADVRALMLDMGGATIAFGESTGVNRATRAAESAITDLLRNDGRDLSSATRAMITTVSGDDGMLVEADDAATRIRHELDDNAEVLFGSVIDKSINGKISVSVVVGGWSR